MQLFANNIETTLVASLSSSATTMYVASTSGMPEPTGSDYFLLTLCKRDSNGVESSIEIVKCTAVVSNSLTIVRAQEGTSGTAYASGDIASLRLTAGSLNDNIMQADGLPLAIGRINNPLLHLPLKNSLDMICGVGSVTFTRASNATYIDRYGVVQSAAVDEARFEKEGLLIEGASTNLLMYSQEFTLWGKDTDTSVTNVSETAPDNNATVDKLFTTANGTAPQIYNSCDSGGGTFTYSVFVKKGNLRYFHLMNWNSTDGQTLDAAFDLNNKSFVGTYEKANYEELKNGWFRIWVRSTVTVSSYWYIRAYGDVSPVIDDYVYLWGAQLEETSFATSYIPTTTAAATRAADKCEVTYAGNVPAKNTEEFSIIADANLLGHNSDSQYLFCCVGETYRHLELSNEGNWVVARNDASVYSCYIGPLTVLINHRIGFVFNKTINYLYIDGELKDSDTHVNDITGTATVLQIGYNYYQTYGHISNFRIYDVALTEAEMRIA